MQLTDEPYPKELTITGMRYKIQQADEAIKNVIIPAHCTSLRS